MSESTFKKFNHLKIHSQYSICEGEIKIDDLKDEAKEFKIKTLGLCDTSNLCGAIEFSDKLSKVGTQPIIGSQINFKFSDSLLSFSTKIKDFGFLDKIDSVRAPFPVPISTTFLFLIFKIFTILLIIFKSIK